MKSIVKWILITAASLAGVFIVGGFLIPSKWSISESIVIKAPVESIYVQVADLKNWQLWSPWTQDKDPTQQYTYEGFEPGVGQKWFWTSEKMGQGHLTITAADPIKGMSYELFMDMKGNKSLLHGSFSFFPVEEGVEVVWSDSGDAGDSLINRWMTLFIKPMLSDNFKEGLAKLKSNLETH